MQLKGKLVLLVLFYSEFSKQTSMHPLGHDVICDYMALFSQRFYSSQQTPNLNLKQNHAHIALGNILYNCEKCSY